LDQKYLYLVVDLLSVAVPLIASFYTKAPFFRHWKFLWVAIAVPAVLFLIWDEFFTRIGIWGFNERYLTGIYVGHLPIEEVLFFVCIPYACVFTYFALNHLVNRDYFRYCHEIISSVLIIALLITGVLHIEKAYTGTTFILLAFFLAYELLVTRARYLSRFYFVYLIILVPFFIVNGILTGSFIDEEVVWYNNDHNLGIRLGTIPVEDVFYGMLLLVMNVRVYETMKERSGSG
jgi:lycopene cyclase domain-containing protein